MRVLGASWPMSLSAWTKGVSEDWVAGGSAIKWKRPTCAKHAWHLTNYIKRRGVNYLIIYKEPNDRINESMIINETC